MNERKVRAAVVQAAPILFDKQSAIQKIASYVKEVQAKGAQLLLFPEVFIAGYPRGLSFGARVRYFGNANSRCAGYVASDFLAYRVQRQVLCHVQQPVRYKGFVSG